MVTLNPCNRLGTIFNQLVPIILVDVKAGNIQSIIENYLPNLEHKCYKLADECENIHCEKASCFYDKEFIRDFFMDTRTKLIKIKKEKNNTFHCQTEQQCVPFLV